MYSTQKDILQTPAPSKSRSSKQPSSATSYKDSADISEPATLSQHQWVHPSPYTDEEETPPPSPSAEVQEMGESVANAIRQLESLNNQIQDKLTEMETNFNTNTQEHKQQLIQSFKKKLSDAAAESAADDDEDGDTDFWIKKYKDSEQTVAYLRMEMERIHRLNETLSRELKRKTDSFHESQEENAQLEKLYARVCIHFFSVCFESIFP